MIVIEHNGLLVNVVDTGEFGVVFIKSSEKKIVISKSIQKNT